jgi:glycosyltransferase involved in cell wall biosynthesis
MKVRVLIVGNFLSSTGLPRGVCEELADRLAAAGWTVLTTSARRGRLARLLDMIATVWRERRSYDVAQVDVYSGKAFLWAELACWGLRLARKPYILTLHGGHLPQFAERWPTRMRRLLRSAAFVTSPSLFLHERMNRMREDIVVLPNALDVARYRFRARRNARPLLVWLRAFHGNYNPSLAPGVVGRLESEFPEIHLTMIGKDKGDGTLQRARDTAARAGVATRVSFRGPVAKDDVGEWLGQSDIFLNTTNVDNAPVSLLEAMACGLCVVSTSAGGVPYLVEDGREALLVPPGDGEAMASAVRRVLREPELAERLSRAARSLAERHDWSVVLPRWMELLASGAAGDTLSDPPQEPAVARRVQGSGGPS